MKPVDFTAYTARCFRGEPASCSTACPFALDVRAFLDKVAKGRWTAAYKLLRNAVLFPVIVAALCDSPCGERCQRTSLGDEAIAIREVEAAVLRNTEEQKPEHYVIPAKDKRVAVVGAGLAGLACALRLAQKRYLVTVFERSETWGGCLRSDPRFADFDADIARQFSAVDCAFHYGTEITGINQFSEFDAVFVATGAGGESFGLLDSWDCGFYATREPKVFLGGMLTGAGVVQAIAEGAEASGVIDVYLHTGRAARASGDYRRESCAHYLSHDGVASVSRVAPSEPGEYTADEARSEAARCLRCDCDACLAGCEMLREYGKDPRKMAVEAHADMQVNPFSSRTLTRQVYSCNVCGRCKSVCPEGVDVGGLLRCSRAARMSAGVAPAALHDYWLREMEFATTEGAFFSAARGGTTSKHVYYPGCQLGAAKPEYVLRTYEVLNAAGHDLGVVLSCCGAPAYWAGDDAGMEASHAETRRVWNELGRPTFVFACATCAMIFASFLPEIGRVSVYELLADCPGLAPASPHREAAVFDPCNARDETGMEAAVRELAQRGGVVLHELPEKNLCCGHGGHIRVANPGLYERIVRNRAEATSQPYLVYCANCRDVFAWRGKECAHILDVALGLQVEPSVPTLEQKRKNSLRVKKELMKLLKDVDFEPTRHEWDELTLIIPPKVEQQMEEKLISAADLKEAIWRAEAADDFFANADDGTRLASLVRPVITYWVQYREQPPKTYEVVAAYYHRMRIGREE